MWTPAAHSVGMYDGMGALVPVPQDPISNATPAGTPRESGQTGAPISPITLVPAMPSMTPPAPHLVTPDDASPFCSVNSWASDHPGLAVLAALGLYVILKGGK